MDSFFLFLIAIIEVLIALWTLKVSAEWAYGKKVSYSQALVQWVALIVIQLLVFLAFSFLFSIIS